MLVTRRGLFAAGGMGAIAIAAGTASAATSGSATAASATGSATAGSASAASASAVEKSNLQLVKDFCQAWSEDPPDADKLASQFLSDDCVVRFGETVAPVSGQEAAIALFQTFLNNGERYELKIVETFAHGPVVVTSRVDSTIKGKKTTNPTQVVGVFIIKDGKIKEWSDYV